jgi:hypothetical protein
VQEFLNENQKDPTVSVQEFREYHEMVTSTIEMLKSQIEQLSGGSNSAAEILSPAQVTRSSMHKMASNAKNLVNIQKMAKTMSVKQMLEGGKQGPKNEPVGEYTPRIVALGIGKNMSVVQQTIRNQSFGNNQGMQGQGDVSRSKGNPSTQKPRTILNRVNEASELEYKSSQSPRSPLRTERSRQDNKTTSPRLIKSNSNITDTSPHEHRQFHMMRKPEEV